MNVLELTLAQAELVLGADPADHPCEMHKEHSPRLLQTEGHHVFPQYLQRHVWGEVRDQRKAYICATGHTNLHLAIADLAAERKWQHRYSEAERRLAMLGWTRYVDACKEAGVDPFTHAGVGD